MGLGFKGNRGSLATFGSWSCPGVGRCDFYCVTGFGVTFVSLQAGTSRCGGPVPHRLTAPPPRTALLGIRRMSASTYLTDRTPARSASSSAPAAPASLQAAQIPRPTRTLGAARPLRVHGPPGGPGRLQCRCWVGPLWALRFCSFISEARPLVSLSFISLLAGNRKQHLEVWFPAHKREAEEE